MATITLTPTSARYLANAALSAASRDDVTPVVTGGELSVIDGTHVQIVATDRYRIHRVALETAARISGKVPPVILSPALLRWLVANARYYNRRRDSEPAVVRITVSPDGARVKAMVEQHDGGAAISWEGPTISGHFPPVGRLIDAAVAAEAAAAPQQFRVEWFAKALALGARSTVKYTAGVDQIKPGPAYLSFHELPEGVVAEALIQPFLQL